MKSIAPVAVIIPTYNRGLAVLTVLDKIKRCDPAPEEVWVHVDSADGILESEVTRRFPKVGVLTSAGRLGPGGGRHRCLLACKSPYAVSFDDDSYPIDSDFFRCVEQLFLQYPRAAIFGASIWQRHELEISRTDKVVLTSSYIGCGHCIRVAAYRQMRGYLPRPVAYRMEECDLSLQLFAAGWEIHEAKTLRVFHDTDLTHHQSPEITSGVITNVALCAFLHYPLVGWGWGLLQVINVLIFSLQMGRIRGIYSGIIRIPADCYRNRRFRKPISLRTLKRYLHFRKSAAANVVVGQYGCV